jgi:hypothetical protein
MFEYIEEPQVVDIDCLSVYEFKSCDEKLNDSFDVKDSSPQPTDKSEMEDVQSLTPSINKTKKIAKKKKQDDFNYKEYIDLELKKMNAENMEGKCRKRLVQKIRNRMSAQRSRQRNKNILESLKIENEVLRLKNEALIGNLKNYRQENDILRIQLESTGQYKKSYSSTDNDEVKSFDESDDYNRQEKSSGGFNMKNFLFISMMIVTLLISPDTNVNGIKMSGFISIPSSKGVKSTNRIDTLRDLCDKYYANKERDGQTKWDMRDIEVVREWLTEKEPFSNFNDGRENELIQKICQQDTVEHKRHNILFKKAGLEAGIGNNVLLLAPKLVSMRMDGLLTN